MNRKFRNKYFVIFSPALSLPKIPSLFIHKGLRTIANSRKTTRNDTIIRKSWSRWASAKYYSCYFEACLSAEAILILENLALCQQLTVQQWTIKRPKLKRKDRIFWAWLSRIWPDWKSNLIIVKPETVIKWHRQGFKLYWCWKFGLNSGCSPGWIFSWHLANQISDFFSITD